MADRDPRVDLSGELLPEHAAAAIQALDRVRVRVRPGGSPAAALTAACLVVLLARTHAHVDVIVDAALPPNPWGMSTLTELLVRLEPLRPFAQAQPDRTVEISTGIEPGADCYISPLAWTVQVSSGPPAADPASAAQPGRAPYGGMFAAAVVAANLFCECLGPLGLPVAPRRANFMWNLLDYTYSPAPDPGAEADQVPAWPRLLLAGCGSVGSSAAAALSCDRLTGLSVTAVDGDHFDPARNAFRYPAATAGLGRTAKADWVSDMLTRAGACAEALVGPVRDWTTNQPAPGLDGIVVSSVDDIDARYEVADVLAATTVSAAVHALSLHVQREHLGDGSRCPFCDFVSLASPLGQAAADAQLTGLSEQRIVELLHNGTGLQQQDLEQLVAAGRLTPDRASGLLGARLADLRNRLYAQAALPSQGPESAPPAPLSAPFVSWATGVLLAAEVAKHAYGLPSVNRRVEVDLHGYPPDFVHVRPADSSGRCACNSVVRRRWMAAMYGPAAADMLC